MLARYATPFAAGALLAAAFLDLLPESLEITAEGAAPRWVLGGIVLFFLLEHFLHWFHHHHEHQDQSEKITAPLIIIGDSIHNFLDGIAIGAAFLINVPTGIVAALAVAAHEIPQEIGDFGLLLKTGMARGRVLLVNVFSALMSTAGAVLTFWLGTHSTLRVGELLALTAGLFIYIAASDLIPTIHEQKTVGRFAHMSALLLIAGVLVVGVAKEAVHEYIETDSPEVETTQPASDTTETPQPTRRQREGSSGETTEPDRRQREGGSEARPRQQQQPEQQQTP